MEAPAKSTTCWCSAGRSLASPCIHQHRVRAGQSLVLVVSSSRTRIVLTTHVFRFWCNLSGMDKHQIRENPRRAQEIATSNGIRNLRVQPLSPGTPGEIKYFVKVGEARLHRSQSDS